MHSSFYKEKQNDMKKEAFIRRIILNVKGKMKVNMKKLIVSLGI